MPIRDPAARRKSIRNDYGVNAAADAPTSHEVALFDGDPMEGGVEITGDGYARAEVVPGDWADDPDEGIFAFVTFPAPGGPWVEAKYWGLYGSDGLWWDCGELEEPLLVTIASDTGPQLQVPLFYADSINELEE